MNGKLAKAITAWKCDLGLAAGNVLQAIFFALLVGGPQKAHAGDATHTLTKAALSDSEIKAEIRDVVLRRSFPRGWNGPVGIEIPSQPGRGPIACAVEETTQVCRFDGLPIKRYRTSILGHAGQGTKLTGQSIQDGCLLLQVRLQVAHRGVEGRTCLEREAYLHIQALIDGPPQ